MWIPRMYSLTDVDRLETCYRRDYETEVLLLLSCKSVNVKMLILSYSQSYVTIVGCAKGGVMWYYRN